MVQGKRVIWTAALALAVTALAGAPAQQQGSQQQGSQQQASGAAQQNAIPDAPHAQTLPNLKTITPVGAAVTAPAALPTESDSDGQKAPGTSLPSFDV